MNIRPLQLSDLEKGFLETLENLSPLGEIDESKLKAVYEEISRDPNHHIFVAEVHEMVRGTITLLIKASISFFVEPKFIHNGGRVAHIEDVVVHKTSEGNGIGRELVGFAVSEARRHGCYKVILNCSEENVPFYLSCGFKLHEKEMRLDL